MIVKPASIASSAPVRHPAKKEETPEKLRGATYNCEVHRDPRKVAQFVSHMAHSNKLDFIQLQEISTYHHVLQKIPGYHLITFPKTKDHGETGVLVRDGLKTEHPKSMQMKEGWESVHGWHMAARAPTAVKVAGWLKLVSVHAPPGIDFRNGRMIGPEQRKKAYAELTTRLAQMAARHQKNHPNDGLLIGGDWNEPARFGGKFSPAWIAAQAKMQKAAPRGIDWELARGAKVERMRVGPDGGSDHHMVLFTVTKPGAKKK